MDKKKLIVLFWAIIFAIFIFFIRVVDIVVEDKRLPRLTNKKVDLAVRGSIYSKDNFTIAYSQKIYKAAINTKSLDPNKKELFIKLFSIYSGISEDVIRDKIEKSLKKGGGYIVLSDTISSRNAPQLKELKVKLAVLKVFRSIFVKGKAITYGLDIIESGEKRFYSYDDALTPVIGYIRKDIEKNKNRVNGIKGLEKYYEEYLDNRVDGFLQGPKDVVGRIIFNKDSVVRNKQNGISISLNIYLKLQRNLEMIADQWKEKLQAKEILICVMDSYNGKILALVSSNRFSPNNILKQDIPNLNIHAIETQFEPGSVIKPIAISIALNKGVIKGNEYFSAFNKGRKNRRGFYPRGVYKLGKRFLIHDDHQFKTRYISVKDIVAFSSNIGTLQIAQKIKAKDFLEGFKSFGFGEKTGIDLTGEKKGKLRSLKELRAGEDRGLDNVYKATLSYGQGMTATFMQLMRAYSVFNNGGFLIEPKLIDYYISNSKAYYRKNLKKKKVLSKNTIKKIKSFLKAVIKKGTAKKAKIDGIEVGGKTGTANIASRGKYSKRYISSFFGFANDKRHHYTIGVTVFEPISTGKYWYYYYASNSAVPIFAKVVKTLIRLDYLKPFMIE